jgi:hypothetical protein
MNTTGVVQSMSGQPLDQLASQGELVRKLDDSDWLFPSVRWENDVDLFAG